MTEWMIGVALLLILSGVPFPVSFGLGAVTAIAVGGKLPLLLAPIQIFGGLNSFLLIAVPFFILAGMLMDESGIAEDIYDFANALVGFLPGGLGHVNVVGSMLFAGMSGSATADAGALGNLEIAVMTKFGYPRPYAAALTASSAILSVLIPPSIMMVLYGVSANQSIARVLVAGVGPGLIVAGVLMAYNHFLAVRHRWAAQEPFAWRRIARVFLKSGPALLTPVILMGGIVLGVFTPTEAAAVAVFYVLTVDLLVHRRLDWAKFRAVLLRTARLTGAVLLILSTASLASFILTTEAVPLRLTQFLLSLTTDRIAILLLINLILLLAGMFLDPVSGIIVFVPLLTPTVKAIGLDMVHFGVIVVTNLAIGLLTPPVGPVLYVVSAVGRISVERLIVAMLPFYVVLTLALLVVTFFPSVSLWLPALIWG